MRLTYTVRLLPRATLAVSLAIGGAFAFRSHVDAPLEQTALILLTTLGLSSVFVDPAAALTDATPTALRRRAAWSGAIAAGIVLVAWFGVRWGAGTALPDRGEWFEWLVVASTQVAVGLVVARRRRSASIAPGAGVALVWLMFAGHPDLQQYLYGVSDHLSRWLVVLVVAIAVASVEVTDPARRRAMNRW